MKNRNSGWTMMETLVLIGIVGILTAAAIPKYGQMVEGMKLRTAAMNIHRTLVAARTRAIADPNVHCGVFFDTTATGSRIYIYSDSSGTPYTISSGDTATKYLGTYIMPKNIKIVIPTSTGITNKSVVFRGDGSAKNGGDIQVTNKFNKTKTINVLAATGRVKVQ